MVVTKLVILANIYGIRNIFKSFRDIFYLDQRKRKGNEQLVRRKPST